MRADLIEVYKIMRVIAKVFTPGYGSPKLEGIGLR